METLSGLLQMGGYGGYVWPAYGIGLLVLGGVLATSVSAAAKAEAQLEQLQRDRKARRAASSESDP